MIKSQSCSFVLREPEIVYDKNNGKIVQFKLDSNLICPIKKKKLENHRVEQLRLKKTQSAASGPKLNSTKYH